MNKESKYIINQVAIIGPGLIGASLGLALKSKKICKTIIGIDNCKKNLKVIHRINFLWKKMLELIFFFLLYNFDMNYSLNLRV